MNPLNLAVVRSTAPLSADEARTLTDRIRTTTETLWSLLLEAYERRAWAALGYDSWRAYVEEEFSISRQRAYQLVDQGRVVRALEEAAGVSNAFDISARDTAALKPQLAEVTEEIHERVEAGAPPAEVVEAVLAEKRGERRAERREREAPQEIPPRGETEPSDPDDPEAYDPEADFDPAAELVHALEENQRLQAEVEALSADDRGAELRKWMERYTRLEGRVQQMMQTEGELKKQLRYQTGLLKKLREVVGVERDRDLLPRLVEVLG